MFCISMLDKPNNGFWKLFAFCMLILVKQLLLLIYPGTFWLFANGTVYMFTNDGTVDFHFFLKNQKQEVAY